MYGNLKDAAAIAVQTMLANGDTGAAMSFAAECEKELIEYGKLRANQLSPAIVAAVRAYQEAFLEHRKASVLVLGGTRDVSIAWDNLQTAIEADAKERG